MASENFRIFRRNIKNTICLWSGKQLTDDQRENIRVYAVEDDAYRELVWKPFVADNPTKFAPDVRGIVIGNSGNQLDPAEPCIIRVMLGIENVIEIEKEVLPAAPAGPADSALTLATRTASSAPAARTINVRLYALDENSGTWVPVPLGALPALKCESILLKETD